MIRTGPVIWSPDRSDDRSIIAALVISLSELSYTSVFILLFTSRKLVIFGVYLISESGVETRTAQLTASIAKFSIALPKNSS